MSSLEPSGQNAGHQYRELEPASWAPPGPNASSLLDQVLAQGDAARVPASLRPGEDTQTSDSSGTLGQFIHCDSFDEQLLLWFGPERLRRCATDAVEGQQWLKDQIDRDVAQIDMLLQRQLNAILHAPAFQKLEASWRGLEYLVAARDQYSDAPIRVEVLNVSWAELSRDFENASEFDQSQLFKKVYEEGIGQAGANSFSAILADYAIHPRLSREHRFDDMNILRGLAQVAAAAFCPLITNAHPSMFAVDNFSEIKNTINLQTLHSGMDFFAWQRFREIQDSRFICLAMPRLLMRQPYRDDIRQGFPFTETVTTTNDYLWGGAAFGMGEVLMRAFADSGWFANIRGAQRGVDGGGLVMGPTADPFTTEPYENAPRALTDFVVNDEFERELAGAGFLPMCAAKDMPLAAFYSASTCQKPKEYNSFEATMSSRLSAMLNYMLCVSRFAHYLKHIARNRIGSCGSPEELQDILQTWINQYVSPDKDASATTRLRKPLLEAEIRVSSLPGRAGEYMSVFQLVPHHELDDMRVSIRLDTRLVKPST